MSDLWRSRRPPEPLDLDALLGASPAAASNGTAAASSGSACKALGLADAHAVWSAQQNAALFVRAVQAFVDERPDELGSAQVRHAPCSCRDRGSQKAAQLPSPCSGPCPLTGG